MSDFDMEAVRALIIEGLSSGTDEDAIRLQMFQAGVPFNKINALLKEVAIEEGFKQDPKVVREGIEDALSEHPVELADWDSVTDIASSVVDDVEGATEGQVISAMKRRAKDAEVDFPKKPKKTSRGAGTSKIKSLIIDTFNANPEIGATELLHVIIEEVTGDFRVRNSIEYVNMYLPMCRAARDGVSLDSVKLDAFDKPSLEAQYGGTTSYTASASTEEADEDDFDEEAA